MDAAFVDLFNRLTDVIELEARCAEHEGADL
jgi:hypothetical protein